MSLWKRMKGTFFWIPKYGFYGAPHYGCGRVDKEAGVCPAPIDWLDNLFKLHDERQINDLELSEMAKKGDVNQLYAIRTNQDWSLKLYARFYHKLVISWFSIQGRITKGNLND